jgi:hypothetical protein
MTRYSSPWTTVLRPWMQILGHIIVQDQVG